MTNCDQPPIVVNPAWHGYRCLSCRRVWPKADMPWGCTDCAEQGRPSNVSCDYTTNAIDRHAITWPQLPYLNAQSLGEGNTPLVAIPQSLRASSLSSSQNGFFKMELSNPTGSHKDRMAWLATAHALATGKTKVLAASSGNAGVAIAAYAALNGLACEIAVTQYCPKFYRDLMVSYGASIVSCADSFARWAYLERFVNDPKVAVLTNFALPAVGSPAVAIEGYKAIAYEVHQQVVERDVNAVLGSVYLPVARGDLLWGLYLGFAELLAVGRIQRLPRLVAVEPFPRLSRVLQGESAHGLFAGHSKQASTSGATVTLQSVEALIRTGGVATVVGDEAAIEARHRLSSKGFLFELCAAAAWLAFNEESNFPQGEATCHVVISTSHGSRDAHLFSPI